MIRGLKGSVICNYDMGVIHLVSFICNMIRGLKVFVICNYAMGPNHVTNKGLHVYNPHSIITNNGPL
jgi:hypothetical protein